MDRQKVTIPYLQALKMKKERIICTSCYDYPIGLLLEKAGVDMVVVGDSVGMVVLGYESTVPVTMEEMLHHAKAVVRACKSPLVVGDMPFGSYNCTREQAISNATRFMKEGGVDAVKVEGGKGIVDTVSALTSGGIPVMGHIGVTPQTVSQLGGYKVRGKEVAAAKALIEDALALEAAGAFAIELECIPTPVSRIITEKLRIPTIGAGAGPYCDGQGLVIHDILGLYDRPVPKLAKSYANLSGTITDAVQTYMREVKEGKFPDHQHSFAMTDDALKTLQEQLGN